jgi:hypothetical protein
MSGPYASGILNRTVPGFGIRNSVNRFKGIGALNRHFFYNPDIKDTIIIVTFFGKILTFPNIDEASSWTQIPVEVLNKHIQNRTPFYCKQAGRTLIVGRLPAKDRLRFIGADYMRSEADYDYARSLFNLLNKPEEDFEKFFVHFNNFDEMIYLYIKYLNFSKTRPDFSAQILYILKKNTIEAYNIRFLDVERMQITTRASFIFTMIELGLDFEELVMILSGNQQIDGLLLLAEESNKPSEIDPSEEQDASQEFLGGESLGESHSKRKNSPLFIGFTDEDVTDPSYHN